MKRILIGTFSVIFIIFIGILTYPSVASAATNPDIVVYYDANYPSSNWEANGGGLAYELGGKGYPTYNAQALATWMKAQESNPGRSMVIMAQDTCPSTICDSNMDSNSLIRQYLNSGGSVIWLGDVPFYYLGYSGGGTTNIGSSGVQTLLGLQQPNEWSQFTSQTNDTLGKEIGITDLSIPSSRSETTTNNNITPITSDSNGSASSWFVNYNNNYPKSGFYRFADTSIDASSAPIETSVEQIVNYFRNGQFSNPYNYQYTDCTAIHQTNITAYDQNATFSTSTYQYSYQEKEYLANGSYQVHNYSGTADCTENITQTSGSKTGGTINWKATATGPKGTVSATGTSYYVIKVQISFNNGTYTYVNEPQSSPVCVKTYGNYKTFSCSTDFNNTHPTLTKTSDTYTKPGIRKICYAYTDPTNGYKTGASSNCVTRVYAEKTQIINPTLTVRTGIPTTYNCDTTFYDGHVLDVSTQNNVWNSTSNNGYSPSNFIGSNRYIYQDPQGRKYSNGNTQNNLAVNQFYSADPKNGTFNITCSYYPSQSTTYSNAWVTDAGQPYDTVKTDTIKVTNDGIKTITLSASGSYWNPTDGKYDSFTNLSPTNGEWNTVDFITGHWYNFQATVQYTDGFTQNITSANEVYWTGENLSQDNNGNKSTPGSIVWYTGESVPTSCAYLMTSSSCWQTNQPYETDFPKDGANHRIPQNNWNYISVQYFNNMPGASYGTTVTTGKLWSHQVVALDIRGAGGTYNSKPNVGIKNQTPPNPPPTEVDMNPVYQGTQKDYTAWVTWSDNPTPVTWTNSSGQKVTGTPNPITEEQAQAKQQNWSSYVTWSSDDSTIGSNNVPIPAGTAASFTFDTRGTFYHTLDASYIDQYADMTGKNKNNWMNQYSTLMVYVEDECGGNYLLVYKGKGTPPCIPTTNWQINLQNYNPNVYDASGKIELFSTQNRSILNPYDYLPPYSIYGLSQGWNQPLNNPNDPYIYYYTFPVTGLSSGLSTSTSSVQP